MKYRLLSFCLLTLFLIAPKDTIACSCTYLGASSLEQFRLESKRDKAVFSGEVLGILEDSVSLRTVKLKIQESWKGQPSGEISISTGSTSGCGYDFEVGESYLVFANGTDSDNLRVSQCSSTTELKNADALVEMLKKLSPKAVGQNTHLIGSVYDMNNAVIQHALIKLKAEDGKIYEALIGKDDIYELSLPVGMYTVEISAANFKTVTLTNYKVTSSKLGQQNLDFKLEVGAIICPVTITEPVKSI